MKLKTKLLLTYLAIAAIPPIVIFVFNYFSIRQTFIDTQRVSLEEIADLKVITVEKYFNEFQKDESIVQEYFNIKVNLPILNKFRNDQKNSKYLAATAMLNEQLSAWRKNRPIVRDIMLFSLDGEHLYSVNPAHWAKHAGKPLDAYYLDALDKGKAGIYLGEIFREVIETNGYPFYFLLSSPVYDFNNKPSGLVVMEVSAQELFDVIQDTHGLGKTGETLIGKLSNQQFDAVDGKIIFLNPLRYDPDAALKRMINIGDPVGAPLQMALKNNNGSGIMTDYRGTAVLAAWRYVPSRNWGLVAKMDVAEVMVPVRKLELTFLFTGIIGLILASFFTWLFARRIARPIETLTVAAKSVGQGKFEKIKLGGMAGRKDEIGVLSRIFGDMVSALRTARENLEKKVEQRTHELDEKVGELEASRKAVLNVAEDLDKEKKELQKFKLAVENASDLIMITDADGIVLYANKSAESITGYQQKEIIGKKAGKLWGGLMPKEHYVKLWDTIKNKKKGFAGEITNRRKNGEKYEASLDISPILGDKNKVIFFVGLERDITKEREIDRAKTEFVSLASHQLRTPLTAIKWYLEMLLEGGAGKLNKEQTDYAGQVYSSNERMIDLVNALLNVSRIEMGTFAIEPKEADIIKIAKEAIGEISQEIKQKNLKFSEKYDKMPDKIMLDKNLMDVVIQNLLTNAIRYTLPGGKISFAVKRQGENILVAVADTGIGIPRRQQDQIFQKLFRADNARVQDTSGTGLGLYITKAIVDKSGGKIWFESKEGKGSTFYVQIPISGMKKIKGEKKIT